MATSPEQPQTGSDSPAPATPAQAAPSKPTRARERAVHEVVFVTYPKLLFVWPIIVLGFVLWPLGYPATGPATPAPETAAVAADASEAPVPADAAEGAVAAPAHVSTGSPRLETLAWIYLWVTVFVFLTMGVDVDRNQAVFWVVFVGLIVILGLWLRDVHQFTLFGNIYRWFANLDIQYHRTFGLTLSIFLLVPYVMMLGWARINDKWRITHNEFEHYSFGRLDDSLGRGAKTIRSSFPDVFELILGLTGTLIVYNATGTKELRRIPHVMFLPLVRKRLNRILERTAITAGQFEEEEEDDDES